VQYLHALPASRNSPKACASTDVAETPQLPCSFTLLALPVLRSGRPAVKWPAMYLSMISSASEVADEPGSSLSSEPDLCSLNHLYATPRYRIARCRFGLGVFAARDIMPGEVILDIDGPHIDFAETIRRGPRECMAIQIGPDIYIDTQPAAVWVNHSCEPNSGIKGDRRLTALRSIQRDEEICFDYSTTMEEASFTMACRCGSAVCRGVVRDFSTLPKELRRKYVSQGIAMSFILRLGDRR
jgi:uncharacterized protein